MCILDIRTKCTEAYRPDIESEGGIIAEGQGGCHHICLLGDSSLSVRVGIIVGFL